MDGRWLRRLPYSERCPDSASALSGFLFHLKSLVECAAFCANLAIAARTACSVRDAVRYVALFLSDWMGHGRLIADVLVGLAAADDAVDGDGL